MHVHAARTTTAMGKVVGCSSGPDPFPGVPVREPFVPQQPGEVLIRYELEAVSCADARGCAGSCLARSSLHAHMPAR